MVFALFLRDKLAEDFRADPATFGRAAMALAYNVRTKAEVDPLIKRCNCGRDDFKAGTRGVLAWLFRLFRRPRWICVGSRLEPSMAIGA